MTILGMSVPFRNGRDCALYCDPEAGTLFDSERPLAGVAGTAYVGQTVVEGADDHGPFADRGCAALDRAGAHVADGEDSGHARLEGAVCSRRWAGGDEAIVVDLERTGEPRSAR